MCIYVSQTYLQNHTYLLLYIQICVCMPINMHMYVLYVYMYVFNEQMNACLYVCDVCTCIHAYIHTYSSLTKYIHTLYVCMYACVSNICMDTCMHVNI